MNEQEYERIINQYDDLIKKVAHTYNVLHLEYEDCYQECLLKLWSSLNSYDSTKSKLSTYIYNVCRNHLVRLNRDANTSRKSNVINGERIKDLKNLDLTLYIYNNKYTKYELEVIYDSLELLEDNKFKDIIVNILNGYTNQTVAEEFGVSKQYINKIYRDFIEKCRNLIVN